MEDVTHLEVESLEPLEVESLEPLEVELLESLEVESLESLGLSSRNFGSDSCSSLPCWGTGYFSGKARPLF